MDNKNNSPRNSIFSNYYIDSINHLKFPCNAVNLTSQYRNSILRTVNSMSWMSNSAFNNFKSVLSDQGSCLPAHTSNSYEPIGPVVKAAQNLNIKTATRTLNQLNSLQTSSAIQASLLKHQLSDSTFSNFKSVLSSQGGRIPVYTSNNFEPVGAVVKAAQNLNIKTATGTLNQLSSIQTGSAIQASFLKYQMYFNKQKFIPEIPSGLMQNIEKNKIILLATQYQSVDFRIPSTTEKIIDSVYPVNSPALHDSPKKEKVIRTNTNANIKKDTTSIDALALTKTLFSFYKANKSKELSAKVLVNGKLISFSELLHRYPQTIRNIFFICLFTLNIINDIGIVEDTIKIVFDFINWLLNH